MAADSIAPVGMASHAITAGTNAVNCTITISPQAGVANRYSVGEYVYVTGTGRAALDTKVFQVLAIGSNTVQINNSTSSGATFSAGTLARQYQTPLNWESSTSIALTANTKYRGIWYDDDGLGLTVNNFGTQLNISGATSITSTAYRRLEAATGLSASTGYAHRYDPVTNTGVRIIQILGASINGMEIGERNVECEGFGIIASDSVQTTSGTQCGVKVNSGTLGTVKLNSIFVRWHMQGPGATGICFLFDSAVPSTTILNVFNCIADGGSFAGQGAKYGFWFASTGSRLTYLNNLAYGCVFDSTSYGFKFDGTSAGGYSVTGIANSICSGNSIDWKFDASTGNLPSVDACVAGDYTLTNHIVNFALDAGAFQGKSATQLWNQASVDDFRNLTTSVAVGNGTTWSSQVTNDFKGVTRSNVWDIGPYDGYTVKVTAAPTVIVNSIGSASRDYATIAAWEAATRLDLIVLNTVYIGELYDDSDFDLGTSTLTIAGARTDPTRYRQLRAASKNRYVPSQNIGAYIKSAPTASSSNVLAISEAYFHLGPGIGIENTVGGANSAQNVVQITTSGVIVDACFLRFQGGTGTTKSCVLISNGQLSRVSNCILVGSDGSTGATYGVLASTALTGNRIISCTAYGFRANASKGRAYSSSGSTKFSNCIGIRSAELDFDVPAIYQDHNLSSDTTAAGLGSLVSRSAASTLFNAPNDFRLATNSPANNAGDAGFGFIFTTDFAGSKRSAPWEIGAYDGTFSFIATAPVEIGQVSRECATFKVERTDGVTLNFTTHNCPLQIGGQVYNPVGGFDASGSRSASGMKVSNSDYRGVISSAYITDSDLRAGRYRHARITESIVDWRYPWASPIKQRIYFVGSTEHDSYQWIAHCDGIAANLARKNGRVATRNCKWNLGEIRPDGSGCKKDISADTQSLVAVTSVTDVRRTFRASSISAGYADDYFTRGEFLWITGANAGVRRIVAQYTQSTREIVMDIALPFDVQTSDTFVMKPGCDKIDTTCKSKFANFLNFEGVRTMPGSHRLMETPQR